MFTPKVNSKQKMVKKVNVFQICLTEHRWPNWNIWGPMFVEPKAGKTAHDRWPILTIRWPILALQTVQKSA